MGQIKEIGLVVTCDRCGEEAEVLDEAAAFYRAFSKRQDASKGMVACCLIGPGTPGDGELVSYEFLCPACLNTLVAAMAPAPRVKKGSKSAKAKGQEKDGEKQAEKPADKPADKTSATADDGPDRDAGTGPDGGPKTAEPGDEELYD